MPLNSIKNLIARLRRGPIERERFVDSHVRKEIAYQIRATRDKLGMSQTVLGEKVGMNQNAISRLESAEYGKPTITTLKRLAAAFDVGLVVRFVPFSEMVYWVSGTTHAVKGLSTESLAMPSFDMEEEGGVFDSLLTTQQVAEQRKDAAVAALAVPNLYRGVVNVGTVALVEVVNQRGFYGTATFGIFSQPQNQNQGALTSLRPIELPHGAARLLPPNNPSIIGAENRSYDPAA